MLLNRFTPTMRCSVAPGWTLLKAEPAPRIGGPRCRNLDSYPGLVHTELGRNVAVDGVSIVMCQPMRPRERTREADPDESLRQTADGVRRDPLARQLAPNREKAVSECWRRIRSPWPRLFQNLRSSRATDWVEVYPSHIVAAWLGHSTAIAAAHYLQVRDHHFDAVIAGSGNHATRHATRATPVEALQGAVAVSQAPSLEWMEDEVESVLASQGVATACMVNNCLVGGEGLEPPTPSV